MENDKIDLLTGKSISKEKAASVLLAKGELKVANQQSAAALVKEMNSRGYITGISKPSAWIHKILMLGKMKENKE